MIAMRAHPVPTPPCRRALAAVGALMTIAGTVGLWSVTVPADNVRTASAAARRPATDVRHEMRVSLDPDTHRLSVTDTIHLPPMKAASPEARKLRFLLHAGLSPVCTTKEASLERLRGAPAESDFGLPRGGLRLTERVPVESYEVELPSGTASFVLRYQGTIEHAPEAPVTESARSFSDTPGTIGPEGVFLSEGVYWYPWFGDRLVSFSLDVTLPTGWDVVAQGDRRRHDVARAAQGANEVDAETQEGGAAAGVSRVTWVEENPQDGITLAAARFTEYVRPAESTTAMVFLRTPDADLANRYLDATVKYLDTYSKMLGPYPYTKFALVENFWESGLGLPSYTLLGPTVLRLPFIIDTSYPHEILHSWWGNSVFVDEASGNWCEGLTAYQADYRLKEEKSQSEGAGYRRDALQKYADFVSQSKDFPLTEFRERESPATEAVGYGKAMMLFHMLRLAYGDDAFLGALRRFYETNRFRKASWSDLAAAFPAIQGPQHGFTAKEMIAEWTSRTGAPRFCLEDVVAHAPAGAGSAWLLEATLTQVQIGRPWKVEVPFTAHLDTGGTEGGWRSFDGTSRSVPIRFSTESRPTNLEVDPDFDLFRRIEREEIPPALSLAFGADALLAVLPSAEPEEMRGAYRAVADAWARGKESTFEVVLDSEIEKLPEDRTVWVFGWKNRFRSAVAALLSAYDAALEESALRIGKDSTARAKHSAALVTPRPGHPDLALGWMGSDTAAALPGLGRKLPHYAKYSYLVFEGDEPTNIVKGTWPIVGSPLTVELGPDGRPLQAARPCVQELVPSDRTTGDAPPSTDASGPSSGTVAAPNALIEPEWISTDRMMDTVRKLSGRELEGRGFGSKGLDAAADLIASAFRDAGLAPGGDSGGWFQMWKATGGDPPREAALKNVVGILPGSPAAKNAPIVVIGAHYDHLGRGWPDAKAGSAGKIHPGADDNASGVAALVELARVLAKERRAQETSPGAGAAPATTPASRAIVFVAFSGEEAGLLGSKHFLTAPEFAPPRCAAMLNFDTVGRLGRGRLLALGAGSAQEWKLLLHDIRNRTGAPLEIVSDDPGGSDQKSFIDAGVPALQFFTGPHADYHTPGDTPDKVDGAGLQTVTLAGWELAEQLARPDLTLHPVNGPTAASASRPAPESGAAPVSGLPGPGAPPGSSATPGSSGARRVSLGTIPDFAYEGAGVRLSGVVPGSPAEKAGLTAGDIIVRLGSTTIPDLRAFADALKPLNPGDKVRVVFTRDGKERSIETEVVGR